MADPAVSPKPSNKLRNVKKRRGSRVLQTVTAWCWDSLKLQVPKSLSNPGKSNSTKPFIVTSPNIGDSYRCILGCITQFVHVLFDLDLRFSVDFKSLDWGVYVLYTFLSRNECIRMSLKFLVEAARFWILVLCKILDAVSLFKSPWITGCKTNTKEINQPPPYFTVSDGAHHVKKSDFTNSTLEMRHFTCVQPHICWQAVIVSGVKNKKNISRLNLFEINFWVSIILPHILLR